MSLLADRTLTLVDEHPRRRHVGHVLQQKSPKALARRVKPRRRVEATDQREEIGERDVHCARASTTLPDGCCRPGAGSSVTRTPVSGRGALGGVSVVIETRPESSGTNVPPLTAVSGDNSQS